MKKELEVTKDTNERRESIVRQALWLTRDVIGETIKTNFIVFFEGFF